MGIGVKFIRHPWSLSATAIPRRPPRLGRMSCVSTSPGPILLRQHPSALPPTPALRRNGRHGHRWHQESGVLESHTLGTPASEVAYIPPLRSGRPSVRVRVCVVVRVRVRV